MLYEAVHESVAEVGRWLSWCHADYSRAEGEAWIVASNEAWTRRESYAFGIYDARSGAFLGGCGFNQVNELHPFANLGYWVRSSCAGRGIAPAATLLLAHFGFEELGLKRIEIVVALENKASQRVAEKIGAVREGMLRNRLVKGDSGVEDAILYSLIPTDLGLSENELEGRREK